MQFDAGALRRDRPAARLSFEARYHEITSFFALGGSRKTLRHQTIRWLPVLMLFTWAANASAFYNPQLQRWINRDPITEGGFDNLRNDFTEVVFYDQNAYSLVGNRPISLFDALGLYANQF